MDMFVVNGGRRLRGGVAVSGAKNAALPVMAAALMAEGRTRLHGIPRLRDVATMADLLRSLGVRGDAQDAQPTTLVVVEEPPHLAQDAQPTTLEVVDERPHVAHYELVRRMRAGVCVLGPLLAKRGRAIVSLPGGCNIGTRPIDLHLKGLRALGAEIRVDRGYVIAAVKRLRGTKIDLAGPFGSTVTGTCNVMSAATLAEGRTVIESAACEPEVVDLGEFLNAMGARISGLGTPAITIDGVDRLRAAEHTVIPDRIEAATLMIAAAMTAGEAVIGNVRVDHLTAVTGTLRECGVRIKEVAGRMPDVRDGARSSTCSLRPSTIAVSASEPLRGVNVTAAPYPGVPTDVQAQLMALLTIAGGRSVVTDRVFPDRFMHAAELNRMGARIHREGAVATVTGVERLCGAAVMASDLRASAALVLAALAAEGTTVIRRIYHLDRGYESLEAKLTALGADVRRMGDLPQSLPAAFPTAIPSPHFDSAAVTAGSQTGIPPRTE